MQQTILDKTTSSICPVCLKIVPARIFSEDGKVFMEKRCHEHGDFKELYWSDLRLYEKFHKYGCDGQGVDGVLEASQGCPYDCGLCQNHLTPTLLGNIDLTRRCNMSCPVCFADSGGRIYEPSLEQIRAMLQNLRNDMPVPCPSVQFSGGEPTLRQDLPEIIALARKMGFSQIQIATNGLILAEDLDLCRALERSGLNTVYLQFDGVTAAPYEVVRGRDVFPQKLQTLENFRRAHMTSTVLVPTLVRGVNDHQVGDIVRFASKNLDTVKGVNFQPISFSGRIEAVARDAQRITIPDLLLLLEEQTAGEVSREDFYPIPFVVPFSRLLGARQGSTELAFTVHPCCGAATYIFSYKEHLIPITRFVDVEGLYERIKSEAENYDGTRLGQLKLKGRMLRELPKFVDESRAPDGLNLTRMLLGVFRNGTRESLKEFHNKTLFVGAMHFQDAYNLDTERLRRCGVHYATPDGRIIPFCAYNTLHRKGVEDRFSRPLNHIMPSYRHV
jgi:hypothetical protein